jgi:hypothetical protein
MPYLVRRQTIAALVLGALVVAGEGWASEPKRNSRAVPAATPAAAAEVAESVTQLWRSVAHFLVPAGCSIDPSGKCVSSQVGGKSSRKRPNRLRYEGCSLDPNGVLHCKP